MWDRKELKARGKAAFKANYWKCVLVGFLLAAFVMGTSASLNYTFKRTSDTMQTADTLEAMNTPVDITTTEDGQIIINGEEYGTIQDAVNAVGELENMNPEDIAAVNAFLTAMQDPETQAALGVMVIAVLSALAFIALIASLIRIFVTNPLEIGCRGFFLRNTEEPAEMNELGVGFHPYFHNVGALLLRDVFIALWSLLFVIPGCIKHYSYRMVPYILAENPEISGKEAITLSRQMMDGHKWNAFVLDLSFIGWAILSSVTLGLAGIFYVNPYKYCTDAELYQALKEN